MLCNPLHVFLDAVVWKTITSSRKCSSRSFSEVFIGIALSCLWKDRDSLQTLESLVRSERCDAFLNAVVGQIISSFQCVFGFLEAFMSKARAFWLSEAKCLKALEKGAGVLHWFVNAVAWKRVAIFGKGIQLLRRFHETCTWVSL